MVYINIPDMNDSMSTITIDEKEYKMRFTYNELYDYWNFGLYKGDDTPLISMVKIVPNFPLLYPYANAESPDGDFGCISELKKVGRNDFISKLAEFVYIPRKDLE